ncbi:Uncharacterised protein [Mycobacteroides abscessus subsp. abscessus]|nr:Uncharacterised protein [Mycobacteroides abscessus subsp. abscessus]
MPNNATVTAALNCTLRNSFRSSSGAGVRRWCMRKKTNITTPSTPTAATGRVAPSDAIVLIE